MKKYEKLRDNLYKELGELVYKNNSIWIETDVIRDCCHIKLHYTTSRYNHIKDIMYQLNNLELKEKINE